MYYIFGNNVKSPYDQMSMNAYKTEEPGNIPS